ncbi:MAG: hypothetical protein JWM17_3042, partial [Actinobacteria bacterium]|nr:hypothetical protein [Actinomycetota bacterium]
MAPSSEEQGATKSQTVALVAGLDDVGLEIEAMTVTVALPPRPRT